MPLLLPFVWGGVIAGGAWLVAGAFDRTSNALVKIAAAGGALFVLGKLTGIVK